MTLIRIKTAAPRPKSWRRKLFWVVLGFLLLLVALYFGVTSAAFLKKVVLPQLSQALKADITVAELQVSPFRRLVLQDVKIQPWNAEPVLTVKEARANYSLFSILRGNIKVSELTLESPVLTIVEDADGRSNLDFLKSDGATTPEEKPAADSASSSGLRLDLKLVTLHNATVRSTKKYLSGASDVVEVSGLNFKLQNLGNGQAGQVELALNVALAEAAQPNRAASSLAARLDGQFTFDLAPDLMPKAIKGGLNLSVTNATGALAELNALVAKLDCETTATEIKQVALRFNKAEVALGEVRVSGPLDLARREGKLKLEVLALDRRVLNLAGAAGGIDFGTTTINASTEIELLRGGSVISLAGRLEAADLQVVQQERTSPTLGLRCDYATTIDTTAKTVEVRFLNVSGSQNDEPFLQSELPHSLTIAWGEAAPQVNDASFSLTVAEFDLSQWRKFLGDKTLSGDIAGTLQLTARNDGRLLQVELTGHGEDFSARVGSNRINNVDGRLTARFSVADLKEIKLEGFRLELLHQAQSVFVATAFGGMQEGGAVADLELTAQVELAQLFSALRVPELSVSNGTFNLQTQVQQKDARQNVTGRFKLTDFSATQGDTQLTHLGAEFDFAVAAEDKIMEIQKLAGQLLVGDKPGGRIEAGGKIDLTGETAQGRVRVTFDEVNQELLRPFLAPALGSNQLTSVNVYSSAIVDFGVDQKFALQAETQITNLVVSTPEHPEGSEPLEIRFGVDVVVSNQVLNVRGCHLNLTPTERARNELNLAGSIDLSQADAISGRLKLSAEALDFTGYYDLFGTAPAPTTPTKSPPPEPSEPALEPEATVLPFQNFTCDVEIGHVYLHEVDVSNWRSTLKISGGQITLNPCMFAVNGGPVEVNAAADLGVPGYRYAVGLNAQSIPLPPLLNTFSSGAGDIGGQLMASLDFKGAGVTGASLQTNLTGQFHLMSTNMTLAIGNVRVPILNLVINTVLGLPDLISGLTGRWQSGQMRWAEEITARPIEVMLLTGGMESSRLEVKEALVKSAAFQVQSTGEIKFAPDPDDSTVHFPLRVSLGRQYAEKLGMVYFNTPANETYIALPNFLTIKGSINKVKTDFSQTGLLLLTGKSLGGVGLETGKAIGNVGLDAGKAVGDAGKFLFGTASGLFKPRVVNPGTNAPAASVTNNVAEPKNK